MRHYTDELRREIVMTGIALAHAWLDKGKGSVPVTNIAKQLARKHGQQWGAISHRLRNVMYFETDGRFGRRAEYSPAWVESEWQEFRRDAADITPILTETPIAWLRGRYSV